MFLLTVRTIVNRVLGRMATHDSVSYDDLYDALDKLGHSKELSEKRVKIYENAAKCFQAVTNKNHNENLRLIIPGSRGEGMAAALDSDLDIIFVQPIVRCFQTYPESIDVQKYVATFQLDSDNVPEGYTKLRLKSLQENRPYFQAYTTLATNIKESLAEATYLRNDHILFETVDRTVEGIKREGWISKNYGVNDPTGPAQSWTFPLVFRNKSLSVDTVPAFPCELRLIFDDWCARARPNVWPSEDLVNAVKESELLVVPVGQAGSEEATLQWRISYTPAEMCLIHSFNDTQIKVYAAMKMLIKEKLKPLCDNITSYIVKNVIFWVFEGRHGAFLKEDFAELLLQALVFLKESVDERRLQNYIFPSRNLLFGKMSEEERNDILEYLKCLTEDWALTALLSCPLMSSMFMGGLTKQECEKRIEARRLGEQLLLAHFALKPDVYNEIEHQFHTVQTPEDVLMLCLKVGLPITRNENPFDFFSGLIALSDAEILWRFWEAKSYDDIWLE